MPWDLPSPIYDPFRHGLKTIDSPHFEIHDGKMFRLEDWQSVTGATTALDYLLKVPAGTIPHFIMSLQSEAEFNVYLYEGPTTTDDGSASNVINCNRNSANPAGMGVFLGPTVTGVGTELARWKLGSGGKIGGTGGFDRQAEIILKVATNYLLRIEKVATGTDWFELGMQWYE